jgi:hypothetical protein
MTGGRRSSYTPGGGNGRWAKAGVAEKAAATGNSIKALENRAIAHLAPEKGVAVKPCPHCSGMKAHSRPQYDYLVNVFLLP